MRKKALFSIFLISVFCISGCSNGEFTKNLTETGKSENYKIYEEAQSKEKFKMLEDEIGLENLSELSEEEILQSRLKSNAEFVLMRSSKVKKDLLTRDNIYKIIERGKYLSERVYEYADDGRNATNPAFTYMSIINASDSLGNFISKELGLELLNILLEFGNSDSITKLVDSRDSKMYEFNYLCALLQRYFLSTDDFSKEEKDLVLPYLGAMTEFSLFRVAKMSSDDILREDWLVYYDNALMFLKSRQK